MFVCRCFFSVGTLSSTSEQWCHSVIYVIFKLKPSIMLTLVAVVATSCAVVIVPVAGLLVVAVAAAVSGSKYAEDEGEHRAVLMKVMVEKIVSSPCLA